MTESQNLADALMAWADLVSSGYEVPAAGTIMYRAAVQLTTLERIIANLFDCGIEDWDDVSNETAHKFEEYIKNRDGNNA